MASAAAISTATLLRPPRVHPSPVVSASPLPMHALPLFCRRPRSLTTACAAVQTQGAVQRGDIERWTPVTVTEIRPATGDKSVFHITLDHSGAPDLVTVYTLPGQYLLTRVPSGEKRPPAFMCLSGWSLRGEPPRFDLLVRSVEGTTSEQLCKLQVGDVVDVGPLMGKGFAFHTISTPTLAETLLLFAVDVGISPIRSFIEQTHIVKGRECMRLFYAAKDLQSMPYQDRFKDWEKYGLKVVPITQQIQESFLEHDLHERILNPLSLGAVIVAPQLLKEVITGVLLDFGVPHNKILTIEWNPEDPFGPNV